MVGYSCGWRYLVLTIFGFIGLIFALSSFYKKKISETKVSIFYYVTAVLTLCFAVTNWIFIT